MSLSRWRDGDVSGFACIGLLRGDGDHSVGVPWETDATGASGPGMQGTGGVLVQR